MLSVVLDLGLLLDDELGQRQDRFSSGLHGLKSLLATIRPVQLRDDIPRLVVEEWHAVPVYNFHACLSTCFRDLGQSPCHGGMGLDDAVPPLDGDLERPRKGVWGPLLDS